MRRNRNGVIAFVLATILWAVSPVVAAACQDCFGNIQGIATCGPVRDGATGFTVCSSVTTECVVGGSFCTEIDVHGGGSGGSGGGGGACHGGAGGCPAECFSCSGGGRPRI
jgi:hypothetical protein